MGQLKNKFECEIYGHLKRKRVLFEYESEKLPYTIEAFYWPDFVLATVKGKVYIEGKGYFRPADKRKLVAVKKQHPELDIRILFYSYNKKNIKWAIKNRFPWAIRTIPDKWLVGELDVVPCLL